MVTYFLNWMGPINLKWIKENGDDWAAGRMDVDGLDEKEHYRGSTEYSVGVMKNADWHRFSNWLDDYYTKDQLTLEEVIIEYEKDNPKIQWLEDEK